MVSQRDERARGRTLDVATGSASVSTGPQRIFIKRRKSRSKSKENDGGYVYAGRKRKAALSEDGVKQHVADFVHRHKSRKNKVARHNAADGPAHSMSRLSIDSAASSSEEGTKRVGLSQHNRKTRPQQTLHDQRENSAREEIENMRREIVELKKETEIHRRAAAERALAIEDLKKELAASKKISRKQNSQLEKLKSSGKKSEELLNTFQANLQCQICLEALSKPFALSPCGHVLCQSCLQEWFRTAPLQADEADDGPTPLVYRRKTCPCCRTTVILRPIPIFLIKSLVTSLPEPCMPEGSIPAAPVADETPDSDPWAGIFPEQLVDTDREYAFDGDDDSLDSGFDSEASSADSRFNRMRLFSPSEGEEDEDEEDEDIEEGDDPVSEDGDDEDVSDAGYIAPQWAPARYRYELDRRAYRRISAERIQLLQRGATMGMIEYFDMRLDPEDGISAEVDSILYYLGWNIERPADDDPNGELFIAWVQNDVAENPERWQKERDTDGTTYRRVVIGERSEVLGLEEDDESEDW